MTGSSVMLRLLPLLSLVISLSALSSSTNAALVIPDLTQRDAPTQQQRDQAHHLYNPYDSIHKDQSNSDGLRPRKSLGHGPVHSHQVFISTSNKDSSRFQTFSSSTSSSSVHSDSIQAVNALPGSRKPQKVALRLAKYLIGNQSQAGGNDKQIELFVRKDSYLDRGSGIYHAFVRQRLNGIQIADADLNVAIDSKGNVLSYGYSLYHGPSPDHLTNPSDSHKVDSIACDQARSLVETLLTVKPSEHAQAEYFEAPAHGQGAQQPFLLGEMMNEGGAKPSKLSELQELLYSKCDDPADSPLLQGARLQGTRSSSAIKDPRQALISFLSHASIDPATASKLKSTPQSFVEMISQSFVVMNLEKLDSDTDGRDDKEDYVLLNGAPETTEEVKATLNYVQLETGKLALAWKLEVPMQNNHYETYVDAFREDVIHSVIDWVQSSPIKKEQKKKMLPSLQRPDFNRKEKVQEKADAKITKDDSPIYKVYEWGVNDPSEGTRALLHGIRDEEAAPLGWHTVPTSSNPFRDSTTFSSDGNMTTYHDTRGNFVFASADIAGTGQWLEAKRPQAKKNQDGIPEFDFEFGYKKALKNHQELDPHKYKDAATTQLFYTINNYAQLLYRYGFDEASGNFQQYNPEGTGGQGGDAVLAFAQDGVGMNNADFATYPDGQHSRMRMYLWTGDLKRDGDFEAGVVIHEYTHGLSTRLVGGPSNVGCLGFGEPGGMGEGWGDFYATAIRQHSAKNRDWSMGSWVVDDPKGIRKYPYSTNMTVDPAMYQSLNTMFEVHAIGAVWAEMLFEVLEALISEHGWQNTLFPPASNSTQEILDDFYLTDSELSQLSESGFKDRSSQRKVPRRGNTLSIQLVTDSFKLMPCRPSLMDSRDAIIQADKHLTGGRDECLIWKAFAKRGLGMDASIIGNTPWGGGVRKNGFSVPKKCKKA